MIALLGGTGVGLVWGWLLILMYGRSRVRRPFLSLPVVAAATILMSLQVFMLTDWRTLAFFYGAAALALFLHLGWCQDLRKRISSTS